MSAQACLLPRRQASNAPHGGPFTGPVRASKVSVKVLPVPPPAPIREKANPVTQAPQGRSQVAQALARPQQRRGAWSTGCATRTMALPRSKPRRIGSGARCRPPRCQRRSQRIGPGRAPPSGPDVPALGYGLALGVCCRESYPFATPKDLAAAGRGVSAPSRVGARRGRRRLGIYINQDCRDVWKVPAAPEAMHRPS